MLVYLVKDVPLNLTKDVSFQNGCVENVMGKQNGEHGIGHQRKVLFG
jgi:hypothetical protein